MSERHDTNELSVHWCHGLNFTSALACAAPPVRVAHADRAAPPAFYAAPPAAPAVCAVPATQAPLYLLLLQLLLLQLLFSCPPAKLFSGLPEEFLSALISSCCSVVVPVTHERRENKNKLGKNKTTNSEEDLLSVDIGEVAGGDLHMFSSLQTHGYNFQTRTQTSTPEQVTRGHTDTSVQETNQALTSAASEVSPDLAIACNEVDLLSVDSGEDVCWGSPGKHRKLTLSRAVFIFSCFCINLEGSALIKGLHRDTFWIRASVPRSRLQ
uniref:Uncharacterized protein n=1 Tax=Knipowitschia caucasica TaxID=637954 RepID=A0AAV2KKJ7_KNICA